MVLRRLPTYTLWSFAALALLVAVVQLERERATVTEQVLETDQGSVSLYYEGAVPAGPLVVVAHGFAGSRQMMQYISRDLARGGFTVAAFDFHGHGRSAARMSPDVTRLEGTTRQLVAQTRAVVRAVRDETGVDGPMALLGHSMATDIVIRAAETLPQVEAIVAISMYSDAVTETFPQRLLIISGAWETRLRQVARETVALVGGAEVEGQTVRQGDVIRRAVAISGTEHVAVLFAAQTMEETRAWLQRALPDAQGGMTRALGAAIILVLGALVILIWPVARLLPISSPQATPLDRRTFLLAVLLPPLPAMAAVLAGGGLLQNAAFGSLLGFFGTWGMVALIVLWRAGRVPGRPQVWGMLLHLIWSLGLFAMALDRYAAAFLPTGPRAPLLACLLLGTLPFMMADRMVVAGTALWQRLLARMLPVASLTCSMLVSPQSMGLLFTVLPVMVLFFAVYGTMARAVELRAGPETAAVALAVILAWSIAASTPLFMAPAG